MVLDMGGTCVRCGVLDESGSLNAAGSRTQRIAKRIGSRADLSRLIVDRIARMGGVQERFVVSVAGPISRDYRVIRKYTNVLKDDSDIPIADMVETETRARLGRNIRLYVIKDAVASSLAEMGPGGAAADRNEVLALILGTGTGGAPCRRLSSGETVFPDSLADLGHHQVDGEFTEPCNCGARGCVERQTSGPAVVRHLMLRAADPLHAERYAASLLHGAPGTLPRTVSAQAIARAARAGDGFTLEVLRESAKPLAILLRNIFTSHPDMTVALVGGFVLGMGDVFLALVREALVDSGIPFVRKEEAEQFVRSRLLLGAIPPDQTNLVGARLFLLQEEKRLFASDSHRVHCAGAVGSREVDTRIT
jgi:glucokinase